VRFHERPTDLHIADELADVGIVALTPSAYLSQRSAA
jgi:hypothetical protein